MIDSVLWRLAWKEYRLLRAFWISIAALTVLIELVIGWSVDSERDRIPALFIVGLALPAFYALGCGATMFATEHETGTYQFQRALPVSALRLMFGKLGFAVVSQVALFATLWCATAAIAGWRVPEPVFHRLLWGLWGIGAIEFLVWGGPVFVADDAAGESGPAGSGRRIVQRVCDRLRHCCNSGSDRTAERLLNGNSISNPLGSPCRRSGNMADSEMVSGEPSEFRESIRRWPRRP